MKIALIYSSKTGNTKKVAEGINSRGGFNISVFESVENTSINVDDYDTFILCYWNDKGTADENMLAFIEQVCNKNVISIGTLGAYPDSEHADNFKNNVKALLESKGNNVIGSFCCQGKIDEEIIERFKSLPEGHPHAITQEKLERYEQASKHPNDEDIQNAIECIKNALTLIS